MQSVQLSADKLSTALLLKRHLDDVVHLWMKRVKEEFPATQLQPDPALLDALPELLEQIGNALRLIAFKPDNRKEISKEHGQQRARLGGYSLKQVLGEMRLLRECLFEVLEAKGGPLAQRERDIILESIERGIAVAGAEFMKLQLDEKNEQLVETQKTVRRIEDHLTESFNTIENLEAEQRLRDLFVSTLTHDLRTPLTSVKLSVDLIGRNLEKPEYVKNMIARIDRGLGRVENMIESLLDANLIREGRHLDFDVKECDLSQLLLKIIEEFSEHYGNNLVAEIPTRPIMAEVAQEKVTRAIENLVSNAIKYGDPEQKITVSIVTLQDKIKISVHNHGVPIPAEDQGAVFDPFFRSKKAGLDRVKGWGLGLTLVRAITEAHGGEVELKSTPEEGTTFSITLPKNKKT